MKIAIGTLLFIIASQSLIGFAGNLRLEQLINWELLFIFTCLSVIGFFIGNSLSTNIAGEKIKTAFGYFVLLMGIFIIVKEIFLSQ